MSEATTAPVSAPAAPAADAPAAPDASQAARTLAARRAAIRGGFEKPATQPGNNPPQRVESSEAPKEPAKPADDDADLRRLIAEDRRVKDEAKKLAAERAALKDLEPDLAKVRAMREAMGKGDRLGALRALFPEADLTSDIFWDLAKQLGGQEGDAEPDVKQLINDTLAENKRLEQEAADNAKREARAAFGAGINAHDADLGDGFGAGVVEAVFFDGRLKTLDAVAESLPHDMVKDTVGAYAEFFRSTKETFERNADKFPGLRRFGTRYATAVQVVRVTEHLRATTGKQPSTSDVLQAIENQIREDIAATPYGAPKQEAQAEAPKPTPTVTSSWRSDPGRPGAVSSAGNVEQKRAAIRERLNQRTG